MSKQPDKARPALAHYHSRSLLARDVWLLFLPGLTAILAPLGYGLWLADEAYARYGPVAAEHWSRPWYFLAIGAGVIFFVLVIYRVRLSLASVKVHQGGVSIRTGIRSARSIAWGEIEGITTSLVQEFFFGLTVRRKYQTRLILDSGKSIRIPDTLQNMMELISRLKANLYPRLFPKLLAEFRSGKRLAFGPLEIHAQGLSLDHQEISWPKVKRVDVYNGLLVIELNDRPARKLPVGRIPNLELVLQLIDQGIPH